MIHPPEYVWLGDHERKMNQLVISLILVAFVLPGRWDPAKTEVASPETDAALLHRG